MKEYDNMIKTFQTVYYIVMISISLKTENGFYTKKLESSFLH